MNQMKNEYICISCIGENTIKIIDVNTGLLVESIRVAERPFDIRSIGGNKLYVACDRSEKIEVIDLLSFNKELLNLPNNGVMDIDPEKKLMYISNGQGITVYNLDSKSKVASVDGCLGIECIFVEKHGSRLILIDSILNQIKIYKKDNLDLIASINNLGLRPRSLLLAGEFDYVYIANEGRGEEREGAGITILDLRSYTAKFLNFPKGSAVTSLTSKGNILYAANRGLKRIDMLNITTFRLFKSIETNGRVPEGFELNRDKTKLYIIERDEKGERTIDVLDLDNCQHSRTIHIGSKDVNPKSIISVHIEPGHSSIDFLQLSKINKWDLKPISVLVKRIYASYTQKICVPEVTAEIKNIGSGYYTFENIVFKNGFIVEESFKKNILENRKDYCRVQFNLRIPYVISLKSTNQSLITIEGYVEEKKDLVMFMPEESNEFEYDILIKSRGELLNSPRRHKNTIKFGAIFFILIRVVGDQELEFPFYNCDYKAMECEEYISPNEELFESFLDFNNTPFPLNLFSIPFEDIE